MSEPNAYADVVIVRLDPPEGVQCYWRSQRRAQFPAKMPRKMKKAVQKIFDDRRLTPKEERLWGKALRAARQRQATRRSWGVYDADQPVGG